MARIENTNLPLAAKGTNSVGVSLIRVLLSFLQGQKLFIHIVPGNIVDFWNSDFLKETQTFWKSQHLHKFFFLAFSLAWIFFLVFFPTHPHHFSNGPSLSYGASNWARDQIKYQRKTLKTTWPQWIEKWSRDTVRWWCSAYTLVWQLSINLH